MTFFDHSTPFNIDLTVSLSMGVAVVLAKTLGCILPILAKAVKLDERTKAMYTGVHINNTEDRAVLHTALRRPAEDAGKFIVDGQDTVADVREVLGRIYDFANEVRSGAWKGVGRNHGGDDAYREHQQHSHGTGGHRKHHGEYNCQPIRRSRRVEAERVNRHRIIAFHHYGHN